MLLFPLLFKAMPCKIMIIFAQWTPEISPVAQKVFFKMDRHYKRGDICIFLWRFSVCKIFLKLRKILSKISDIITKSVSWFIIQRQSQLEKYCTYIQELDPETRNFFWCSPDLTSCVFLLAFSATHHCQNVDTQKHPYTHSRDLYCLTGISFVWVYKLALLLRGNPS